MLKYIMTSHNDFCSVNRLLDRLVLVFTPCDAAQSLT
jgi:hypothetical protein